VLKIDFIFKRKTSEHFDFKKKNTNKIDDNVQRGYMWIDNAFVKSLGEV
jgi:hypothetical protein